MRRRLPLLLLALLALMLTVDGRRRPLAALDPSAYSYFPTASTLDGRMLCLAGTPLETLAGNTIELRMGVQSGTSSFEVGIFDGETGKNAAGQIVDPGGSWDAGSAELEYTLYADRLADGTGTTVIGRWFGNRTNSTSGSGWTASASTMPDNNWWNLTISTNTSAQSPAGHYFYRMTVRLLDPHATSIAAFKVRTSGGVSLVPGSIGYMGVLNQYTDAYAVYPTWGGDYPPADPFFFSNAPTTYDGNWRYYLDLNTSTTELRFWDGDLDKGNGPQLTEPALLNLAATVDLKDPDSPDFLPDFAIIGNERIEAAQGIGSPEEDSMFDIFRRAPGIDYTVTDPNGHVYRNENPSGNLEWEQFRVTTDTNALRPNADYSPTAADDDTAYVRDTRLMPGVWKVDVTGVDMGNLCFLRFDRSLLGVKSDGEPITPLRPLLLGDKVWRDSDLDGVLDSGETGIGGVVLQLLDAAGEQIATTTTDSSGNYSFNVGPGTYAVKAAYSNFGPGRALVGLNPTVGGNRKTAILTNANVLNADLGYGIGGALGGLVRVAGTVWNDYSGNGVQETSEVGLVGVSVNVTGPLGLSLTTTTNAQGEYEFNALLPGTYTVRVISSTLPPNMDQTFDPDGLSPPHQTVVVVSATSVNSGVSFGYTASCGTGNSSISQSFNSSSIGTNRWVWFSAQIKYRGDDKDEVRIEFRDVTLSATINGTPVTVPVPDGIVYLDPKMKEAETDYSSSSNTWTTYSRTDDKYGYVFLTGIAVQVPSPGFPGSMGPITMSGKFSSDHDDALIDWRWAAAVYTNFSSNYDNLNVKPVDNSKLSKYHNSDKAGSPQSYKKYLVSGGTGSGKGNYTGNHSATKRVEPCVIGGGGGEPFTTYTQGGWGAKPSGNNVGRLLSNNFAEVYPGGSVTIGGNRAFTFTSASAIEVFLPQGGSSKVISSSRVNPTGSYGTLTGQLLALQLNVDFSNAGILRPGLQNLELTDDELEGWTVFQVLVLANRVVGGDTKALPKGLSLSELNGILTDINENFDNGNSNEGYLE